jgi:xylulokinase
MIGKMKNYILAHDIGTTGNKATLYDREGKLVGSAFYGYDTTYEYVGWAEQNPDDWWQAVCVTTHQLLAQAHVPGEEIACITFSGQMQGAVPLDKQARPLRPAIIWADQRAGEQVQRISEKVGLADVYHITGHRLSAAYSLHKILWIRDHQPDIYRQTYKFAHAKDSIAARLTGEFATDPSDASGMNLYDLERGDWSAPILEAAQLDPALLPKLMRSVDVVGGVLPGVAEQIGVPAGTPVVVGGGDGACASVGAGSIKEGVAYTYVGSSAWVATAAAKPIYDPDYRTMTFGHVVPGLVIPMGAMQTAGAAYQWMRDQLSPLEKQMATALGVSAYGLMNTVAAESPAGANGLVFLPYLLGERAPRWNPQARAAFIGLTIRHTRADMIRAVMEGVAMNLCLILDALRDQGARIDAIRAIGGGIKGQLWVQIMADFYGAPIHRLAVLDEATSMGGAVIGGVGIGLYPDFSIAEHMNPIMNTTVPNVNTRAVYDASYRIFDAAYKALEPIYQMLAGVWHG